MRRSRAQEGCVVPVLESAGTCEGSRGPSGRFIRSSLPAFPPHPLYHMLSVSIITHANSYFLTWLDCHNKGPGERAPR